MPKIIPLHDRLVVKQNDPVTKTEGGIVIPDTTADQNKPVQGKVIAVGQGRQIDGKIQPLQVKVGDEVLFGKYAGTAVKLEGVEYLVMREEDVMGIVA